MGAQPLNALSFVAWPIDSLGLDPPGRIFEGGANHADVPLLDGVEGYLKEGLCPGGTRRNLDHAAPNVDFDGSFDEAHQLLLADAQTSGGLLIAVEAEKLGMLLAELKGQGVPVRAVIGEVRSTDTPGRIRVE